MMSSYPSTETLVRKDRLAALLQCEQRYTWLRQYARSTSPAMNSTWEWGFALPIWALPRARTLEEAIDQALAREAEEPHASEEAHDKQGNLL